jgi:UDP-N-acetylmuramoylalanine--D-glutamate ligase
MEQIRKRIENKKVLILGFGREGKSTLKLFLQIGGAKELAIGDVREISLTELAEQEPEFAGLDLSQVVLRCGTDYQQAIDDYDLVMKSPGIVLEKTADAYQVEILSQMQLVFEEYREQIIGITGTKGKSTTTTLLYHILKEAGRPAVLAGNIGIPVFDMLHQLTADSILVLELSCHQLEYMTVSPKCGILLNIYEEHLDHYGTMERYIASKEKIYVNQIEGDVLYVHPSVAPKKGMHKGKCILVNEVDINQNMDENQSTAGDGQVVLQGTKMTYGERSLQLPVKEMSLLGAHNYLDIAFVYGICCDLGISDDSFLKGLCSYIPLPHRLQYIGTCNDVSYYDDSISTIDETTIQALNTIPNADTILIGGMDRGISYVNLERYLSDAPVAHIILMEETGKRIYEEIQHDLPDFKGKERLHVVAHLEDAVSLAKEITQKGGSCILSPAAASYGIFKNFEERGDCFRTLVFENKI